MTGSPTVTVVMANYNGASHLEAAVRSVLRQTLDDLELLVVDDGSTDESPTIIERLARQDGRVRPLLQSANAGPAAARNRGLDAARGRWIAIVDSDDLMHPQRLERLVAIAEASAVDIIADDLLVFYDDGARKPHRFLAGKFARRPVAVEAPEYIRLGSLYARGPSLGFLKPLFRANALGDLRYDVRLRVAEDFDFVARALVSGLTMRTEPFPYYLYRKHAASTSHRLKASDVEAMLGAAERFGGETAATRTYRASLRNALAYERTIAALRDRKLRQAALTMLRAPWALPLLWMPVSSRLKRLTSRLRPRKPPAIDPMSVCLLSRQRLIGRTNGSSTYLLMLCRGLSDAGFKVHLVQPSPLVFGRWPLLRLRSEMDVFASHAVRGGIRLGRLIICVRPAVWLAAARGVAARLLARARLPSAFLGARPAPYAIAAPWRPEDVVFLARRAASASAMIADYAFQNVMLPYAPNSTRSAVIMHDLFSRRAEQFDMQRASDSTVLITEAEEMKLLGLADTIVAIQDDEANHVRARVARSRVIVAPMGFETVAEAAPGSGKELLFVGSNTAPNVIGLHWFFDAVWPEIGGAAPDARLTVAGSVAAAFTDAPPPGVTFAGLVGDLGPLYARAALVISPLTVGSGLKIKLIEAMAQGKAVVATSVTLQGVEALVGPAVVQADTPAAFAEAILSLLASTVRRRDFGGRALKLAKLRFGVSAACRQLVKALT